MFHTAVTLCFRQGSVMTSSKRLKSSFHSTWLVEISPLIQDRTCKCLLVALNIHQFLYNISIVFITLSTHRINKSKRRCFNCRMASPTTESLYKSSGLRHRSRSKFFAIWAVALCSFALQVGDQPLSVHISCKQIVKAMDIARRAGEETVRLRYVWYCIAVPDLYKLH